MRHAYAAYMFCQVTATKDDHRSFTTALGLPLESTQRDNEGLQHE